VLPGERERVWLYGPDNCARYAASETPPLLATVNADSYAWMATSMYFRKHWPQAFDGGPQPLPQPTSRPAPPAVGASNTTTAAAAAVNPGERRNGGQRASTTADAPRSVKRAVRQWRAGDAGSLKFRRSVLAKRQSVFDEAFSFSRPQELTVPES
jgi:hypothetical protein